MTTSSNPRWSPVDDDTYDLLTAVADPNPLIGADVPTLFLDACRADAIDHGGYVSVNRVRARLADHDIPPRRYSALWSHFTGPGKPMTKAVDQDGHNIWEQCSGSTSGNDGRPYPVRRWVA